ncbi:MAG: hypothetical protein U0992_10235 [Planctomycetaceae bacterium]
MIAQQNRNPGADAARLAEVVHNMLTVDQALDRIVAETQPLAAVRLPLMETLGRTLAEDIISDSDSPPFAKSLMDGFAIRSGDVHDAETALRIVGELTAGQQAARPLGSGERRRIMTGAPIPDGADAVVRIEDAIVADNRVRFRSGEVKPGQDVLPRGTSMRTGRSSFRPDGCCARKSWDCWPNSVDRPSGHSAAARRRAGNRRRAGPGRSKTRPRADSQLQRIHTSRPTVPDGLRGSAAGDRTR